MVAVIGEAAVAIRPETGGFNKPAEDGVLGSIGGIAKKATLLLGAAFAAGAVVDGLKSFYDAAAESAKIGRLTEQVIKSTGGAAQLSANQVGDLDTAISNKTGVDDEAIQSGANLLLTFTNIKNAAGKGNDIFTQTTQIMTDMSAALGTDASGSAIQLGKALNDPVKGISALSKVGVSFTAQQKEQVAAMVKAGDTLGAQKLILGELNKEFGGAAAAASSPLDKLKVNLGNIQEAIGANLLPVVADFADFATGTLLPAFNQLSDVVGQAFNILFKGDFTGGPLSEDSGVVDTLFNIRDGFIKFKDSVVAFVTGDTFAAWMQIAKDLAAQVWSGLQILAGFITGTLVPAFLDVVGAIGQVAEFFRQHEAAATALGIAVGIVAGLVVAAWAMQVAAAIAGAATSVISWVAVAIGAQEAAAGTTRSTAQIVFGWVAAAAGAVVNAAVIVAQWAWAALSTGASWVAMGVSATVNAVKVGAVWLAQTLATTASIIAGWAVAAAAVVAGWVVMAAQSLIQAARMAAAWFIALGPVGWIIAAVIGLVALIIANWDTVVSWTKTAWEAVTGALSDAWEWIKGIVQQGIDFLVNLFLNFTLPGLIIKHWDTIKQVFTDGINAVVNFMTSLPGKIIGAIGNLGSLLYSKGTELIQGLVNGIANAASFVGNVAKNVVNAVIGFVNDNIISGINNLLEFTIAGVHINPPDIPRIPKLHSGGIFDSGQGEGLALLRDQERVITPEQRRIADRLLAELLSGTLPTPAAGQAGAGITVNNTVNAAEGQSATEIGAIVSRDTVWALGTSATRLVPVAGGV